MKLFLLILAIVGYCFDINSGCCSSCQGSDTKNSGSKNGGPGGDRSPKSSKIKNLDSGTKGRNTGSGVLDFSKIGVCPVINKAIDTSKSDVVNNKVSKVEIHSDSVEIIDGKGVIDVEEITSADEKKKLVYENFVGFTKVYKYTCDSIYNTAEVTVDKEIEKLPYFSAIVKIKDDNNCYVVNVVKESGVFDELFAKIMLTHITILSSKGAISMQFLFWKCINLSTVYIVDLDTTKVTAMRGMFMNCESLESLDLRKIDTSEVTNMDSMFSGCLALKTLDLGGFNTSKVFDMSAMFYKCKSLSSLDLSSFITKEVVRFSFMFEGCSELTSLDLSTFTDEKPPSMYEMFKDASKLVDIRLSGFKKNNSEVGDELFKGCNALKNVIFGGVSLGSQCSSQLRDLGLTSSDDGVKWNKKS